MDQPELVERARRRDHDAFAVLVRVSVARLGAVARLILRDPELARDAVQEACFRAWRNPDRFDTWLRRPAVADALGVPLGSARSRLARALATMRRSLDIDNASEVQAERRGQYA
jgi:RNA polymerase sigma-70 factor (ECF subfamily)